MEEKLLPKGFFKKNPLDEISAARLLHFAMTYGFQEDSRQLIQDAVMKHISDERLTQIEAERSAISKLDSGEAVVRFMRGGTDILNRQLLSRKALSMREEVMPLLLRRFRTSCQDSFLDTAGIILANTEREYIEELARIYPEIRNPYAKSIACLVFGVQDVESAVPLLLREYQRMKEEYPEERFCQGPLLALYCLYGKL